MNSKDSNPGDSLHGPVRIFLQWHGDVEPEDTEPCLQEVTWSNDRIFMHDVEYVRQDLPLSTGKTRNHARELLGEVLRHRQGLGSHGCVEVVNAIEVVDMLIADRNRLGEQNEQLLKEIRDAINHEYAGELKAASDAVDELEHENARLRTCLGWLVRACEQRIPWSQREKLSEELHDAKYILANKQMSGHQPPEGNL